MIDSFVKSTFFVPERRLVSLPFLRVTFSHPESHKVSFLLLRLTLPIPQRHSVTFQFQILAFGERQITRSQDSKFLLLENVSCAANHNKSIFCSHLLSVLPLPTFVLDGLCRLQFPSIWMFRNICMSRGTNEQKHKQTSFASF